MATQAEVELHIMNALNPLSTRLGMDGAAITRIYQNTLDLYGVTDPAQMTDVDKWRALAVYAGWDSALVFAMQYDFAADGGNYKRNQLHDQIDKRLEWALNAAAPHLNGVVAGGLTGGTVVIERFVDPTDPYVYRESNGRR